MSASFSTFLEGLAAAVEGAVEHAKPVAAARVLKKFLTVSDLLDLECLTPSSDRYRQHHLYIDPRGAFSVVALVWLAGQRTPIHDHISWCTVGIYRGRELETRYALADCGHGERLRVVGTSAREAGEVESLVPGDDIHDVINPGPDLAVSIHIYGADIGKLGTSILRSFESAAVDG